LNVIPFLGESSYDGGENLTEERKQREQLLELNHLIARQVMEKSRMVAGNFTHMFFDVHKKPKFITLTLDLKT
jgi:hypothetical protein